MLGVISAAVASGWIFSIFSCQEVPRAARTNFHRSRGTGPGSRSSLARGPFFSCRGAYIAGGCHPHREGARRGVNALFITTGRLRVFETAGRPTIGREVWAQTSAQNGRRVPSARPCVRVGNRIALSRRRRYLSRTGDFTRVHLIGLATMPASRINN